jgi:hypothetical protein
MRDARKRFRKSEKGKACAQRYESQPHRMGRRAELERARYHAPDGKKRKKDLARMSRRHLLSSPTRDRILEQNRKRWAEKHGPERKAQRAARKAA